MNNIWWIFV